MIKNRRLLTVATLLLYLFSLSACSEIDSEASQTTQTTGTTIPAVSQKQSCETFYEKNGVFKSTDGTVEFTWNIAADISTEKLPVVDVAVHKISDEEASRIANVLFDGACFYEPEDAFEEDYSNAELQKKLDIWQEYANIEKMTWLYPYRDRPNDNYIAQEVELVQRFIDEYTEKLSNAPIEKNDAQYDWVFRNDGLYGKGYLTDCEYSGLPYRISSNGKQYSVYLYTGAGPSRIEEDHYRALLCRTKKPDEALLQEIQSKAEDILAQIGLGDWVIEGCTLNEQNVGTEESPVMEYDIRVDFVPSYLGQPTMSWNNSASWGSQANYMNFAPGGELLNFTIENIYDFHSFTDGSSAMGIDEIMTAAQDLLEKQSYSDLGMSGSLFETTEEAQSANIWCKVNICELKYGLLLTQHPNHAGKMQFVPALILNAEIKYAADEAGTDFIPGEAIFGVPLRRVLAISAIDGTEVPYPE
ncbi:MAG: hypothetical protein IJ471_05555 [Eubacterium sp.]|nr:hypothetical protein [Eubacterium sp.]